MKKIMNGKSEFLLAFLAVCISQPLIAQATKITERANQAIASYRVQVDDELGFVEIPYHEATSLTDWAQIEWTILTEQPEPDDPTDSAALPFHAVGSIQRVGERRFIVSGFKYSNLNPATGIGMLCRVRLAGGIFPQVVIDEQVEIGQDPWSILWHDDQGHLYLHDQQQAKLWGASWAGWPANDSTPNLPNTAGFQEIANSAAIPHLLESFAMGMHKRELAEGGGILLTLGLLDNVGPTPVYFVVPFGASWAVAQETPLATTPRWFAPNAGTVTADGFLTVGLDGSGNRSFDVKNFLTGITVATGTIPDGDLTTSIATPDEFSLEPGTPFQITGVGGDPSLIMSPLHQIGIPFGPPQNGLLDRVWTPTTIATIGNQDFGPCTELKLANDPNGQPVPVTVHLGLAFRDPVTGQDPVTDLGGGAFLLNAETTTVVPPAPALVLNQNQAIAIKIPIPLDPNLVGSVALWQFAAVFSDGTVAFSDIAGHLVWPENQVFSGGGSAAALAVPVVGGEQTRRQARRASQRLWITSLRESGFAPGSVFRNLRRKE